MAAAVAGCVQHPPNPKMVFFNTTNPLERSMSEYFCQCLWTIRLCFANTEVLLCHLTLNTPSISWHTGNCCHAAVVLLDSIKSHLQYLAAAAKAVHAPTTQAGHGINAAKPGPNQALHCLGQHMLHKSKILLSIRLSPFLLPVSWHINICWQCLEFGCSYLQLTHCQQAGIQATAAGLLLPSTTAQ
jgi:hypothetical protein